MLECNRYINTQNEPQGLLTKQHIIISGSQLFQKQLKYVVVIEIRGLFFFH